MKLVSLGCIGRPKMGGAAKLVWKQSWSFRGYVVRHRTLIGEFAFDLTIVFVGLRDLQHEAHLLVASAARLRDPLPQ